MMRVRLLSLVLAMLLAFSGAAFAESENPYEAYLAYWQELFDSCPTGLLLQVRSVIDVELATREDANKEILVPQGWYIVGIDIPADTYTITAIGEIAVVYLYTIDDQLITYHSIFKDESIGRIDLQFGQKVGITDGAVVFSTYKGLGF